MFNISRMVTTLSLPSWRNLRLLLTPKWSKKQSLLPHDVAEYTRLPYEVTDPGIAYAFHPSAVNLSGSAS